VSAATTAPAGAAGVRVGEDAQNTIKATLIAEGDGVTVWSGAIRPGRMHDQAALRVEGIDPLIDAYPPSKFSSTAPIRAWPKITLTK
jgi:hypothetical protein